MDRYLTDFTVTRSALRFSQPSWVGTIAIEATRWTIIKRPKFFHKNPNQISARNFDFSHATPRCLREIRADPPSPDSHPRLSICGGSRQRAAMKAMPLDIELIEDAIADTPQLLRNRREELIDDRRFAEAIYRVALASGLMEQVAYQDTMSGAG